MYCFQCAYTEGCVGLSVSDLKIEYFISFFNVVNMSVTIYQYHTHLIISKIILILLGRKRCQNLY